MDKRIKFKPDKQSIASIKIQLLLIWSAVLPIIAAAKVVFIT
jgi:hypothetical protein